MPRSTRTRPGPLDPIAILLAWDRPTSPELRGGAEVDQKLTSGSHACRVVDTVAHEVRDFQGLPSGASRTRTGDLLGAIQALSQLSYSPAGVHGSAGQRLGWVVGRRYRLRAVSFRSRLRCSSRSS